MRPNAILEIIDQLEGLDVDDRARLIFKRLVLEVGAAHGIGGVARGEQVAFARRLLDMRVSRATIRDRLIALYGVSRRQAYLLIGEALRLCKRCP